MNQVWKAEDGRYGAARFRRCGRSGILLPAISLGLWQNFGGIDRIETGRQVLRRAFDRGVTHFDLANNYGPPPGSAEEQFGRILATDFRAYRDELIISTKAGYPMWPGPYGDRGSRKYLLSSLERSLVRMGLDRVDIFYSHRPDPETPMEETMGALDQAVRSGKALYAGLSNYSPEQTRQAAAILKSLGTPCLIHQPRYSMLDRVTDGGLLDVLGEQGIGCIVFSPLAQGLLSSKYLEGIPEGSRATRGTTSLKPERLTPELQARLRALNDIARERGQSLAQMALSWVLRDKRVTSALIGARDVAQLDDSLDALAAPALSEAELAAIEPHLPASGTAL
ncbi:L-glyceraldehyde 3-phosphate reductase [Geminicoccus roseus]|uniref:L-glyceraldehyde 3-phosphate reductase n=1 Tax=Geminicoccus roseus TaxID=404900 RepID=UPI0003FFBE94|nr:L-glyceraldehyde 3-phosphate reductase [Geminicoccus roseus]